MEINCIDDNNVFCDRVVPKVRSLKRISWWCLVAKNVGLKMVYNFLGIDEKTQRNFLIFDKNIRTVYSNIHEAVFKS